jgi:hypothetical protein
LIAYSDKLCTFGSFIGVDDRCLIRDDPNAES